MGHHLRDSSTYVVYYISDFISAENQAIVLESEPQKDLVHYMSRLHQYSGDTTKLKPMQHDEINHNPVTVAFLEKWDEMPVLLKSKKDFRILAKANGTRLEAELI